MERYRAGIAGPHRHRGVLGRPLDRLQRAFAERSVDTGAGALGHELPGVTLVIDLGGRGARSAGTGGAIILALERNAVAFLLFAGDCGIYNVGTLEHARPRSLATSLTAHVLHEARARSSGSASLQSTSMAERVYAAVGFRDLGRFLEYVPPIPAE